MTREQTYKENRTYNKKKKKKRPQGPRASGRVSATTLAAELSLILPLSKRYRAGRETVQALSDLPSAMGTFLSQKSLDLQFCALIFLSLSRNNSIPWIHLTWFPSLLSFSSSWPWKRSCFLFQQSERKLLTKWRLTGNYKVVVFFQCERHEMKKWKCNGLPAFNSYPVASYISKAATSVPLKWSLFFYFVHITYKLRWMLNSSNHLAIKSLSSLRHHKLRWSIIIIESHPATPSYRFGYNKHLKTILLHSWPTQ